MNPEQDKSPSPWAQARMSTAGGDNENQVTHTFTSVSPSEIVGVMSVQMKRWLAIQEELSFDDQGWLKALSDYAESIFNALIKDDEQMIRYNSGFAMSMPDIELIRNTQAEGVGIVLGFEYGEAANAFLNKAEQVSIIPFVAVVTDLMVEQVKAAQVGDDLLGLGTTIDLDDLGEEDDDPIAELPDETPADVLDDEAEPDSEPVAVEEEPEPEPDSEPVAVEEEPEPEPDQDDPATTEPTTDEPEELDAELEADSVPEPEPEPDAGATDEPEEESGNAEAVSVDEDEAPDDSESGDAEEEE